MSKNNDFLNPFSYSPHPYQVDHFDFSFWDLVINKEKSQTDTRKSTRTPSRYEWGLLNAVVIFPEDIHYMESHVRLCKDSRINRSEGLNVTRTGRKTELWDSQYGTTPSNRGVRAYSTTPRGIYFPRATPFMSLHSLEGRSTDRQVRGTFVQEPENSDTEGVAFNIHDRTTSSSWIQKTPLFYPKIRSTFCFLWKKGQYGFHYYIDLVWGTFWSMVVWTYCPIYPYSGRVWHPLPCTKGRRR